MKLGIHSAAFVKDWAEDIIPYIKECHSRGYEVIEVSLLGQTKNSAEKIAKLANDLNISLTAINKADRKSTIKIVFKILLILIIKLPVIN